ncbi:MAG: type I secretion system permease/ATPase [Rhodobacteraceae bacterium]|nr:MAG: type I secretion system permease/ATPase [Paracoccaceae bacterium]
MPQKSYSVRDLRPAGLLSKSQRSLLWVIGAISVVTNLLMLTGPIFMLQVYDRVLSSQSEATLVVLTGLVAFLYLMFGLLDHARARIAARLGAQLQARLDRPLFSAALGDGQMQRPAAPGATQDLAFLQQVSGAPVFMALFDFPWVPLMIGVIALLHPVLGLVALGSALLLAGLGALSLIRSRPLVSASQAAIRASEDTAQRITAEIAQIDGLGMRGSILARWQALRANAVARTLAVQDDAGRFGASARALRLFLQSAILATGAWLVLQAQLSAGGMIAASIILGRALAPLDQLIGGWPQLQAARAVWGRIRDLAATVPAAAEARSWPKPTGQLSVANLSVRVAQGTMVAQALLHAVSFDIRPGQAIGVIGPTGAGKSTLAEALAGVGCPTSGDIRLGGIPYTQYPREELGRALGYLPQHVTLFHGSLRENIARFDPSAREEDVIEAALIAGVHDLILSFPQGYDTPIAPSGPRLSAGQTQRIGLARALYGDPALLILDEPNAHLDDLGCRALNQAIRATKLRGGSVVVVAHRPSAIAECDLLMKLDRGVITAFGPAETVLKDVTRNSTDIAAAMKPVAAQQSAVEAFPWEWRGARAQS